ncbi:MAG: hypothetical protein F4Y24_01520 [Gemmatimonadetes bacterium]|nr:hypothetical protein [Gemmatimonadota bacterium]MYG22558.1 hypothetical protein [Gemmatimonadota bacterium]MYJ38909.1 hypothetical protein [Gemmatimonadota bacterium]
MDGNCHQCGRQEFLPGPIRIFFHTVTALGSPVQVERPFTCANCGQEIQTEVSYHMGQAKRASGDRSHGRVENMRAMISMRDDTGQFASVQYPAVWLTDTREVLPTREGTIQDGTVVDRHGDPELMARFAAHYLSAYRAAMPNGRPPRSVVEIMPALHLLVMATELVIKADLMRSDKDAGNRHSLRELYEALDDAHRQDADDRFARCDPNAKLAMVGQTTLTISDVLAVYDSSYGGASKVYLDTRYYAEPTTKFRESTGLHGANLVKASTPYPIFLPHVVEHLIATFRFFDGAARLQRLGGQVRQGARAAIENNHGDWGLVPSSLDLIVLQVAQNVWMDANGGELPQFRRWIHSRPPIFSTAWKYGGSRLLFYRPEEHTPSDSEQNIDGIRCRIWRDTALGMHSRDLYRLANALESTIPERASLA